MKPALFKLNSKESYVALLAAAFILSYFKGQEQNAALVYYGSFGLLFACLIVNKSYLRPGYLFLFMLNPYVVAGTVGLWVDLNEVFPAFAYYSTVFNIDEFLVFFRVGLVALLGVALPLAWERSPNPPQGQEISIRINPVYKYFLLFLIFAAIAGDFIYAYSHREMFIDSYIFNYQGYHELQHMPIVYLNAIIFGLTVIYIVVEPQWTKSRLFWIIVGLFALFSIKTGMRGPLIIFV